MDPVRQTIPVALNNVVRSSVSLLKALIFVYLALPVLRVVPSGPLPHMKPIGSHLHLVQCCHGNRVNLERHRDLVDLGVLPLLDRPCDLVDPWDHVDRHIPCQKW